MNGFRFLLLLIFFHVSKGAAGGPRRRQGPETCGEEWIKMHRACYKFDKRKLSWDDAKAACVAEGGDLTSISSVGERKKVTRQLQKQITTEVATWWVGLKFYPTTTKFVWEDGGVFNRRITRWGPGEPNSGRGRRQEHCVELSYKGFLHDQECDELRGFVCERHEITQRPVVHTTVPSISTTCKPLRNGTNCSMICSEGCSDTCDRINGHCECKPGYEGNVCVDICPPGSYGVDCSMICSEGCSDTCNRTDGRCHCKPGYEGQTCVEICPPGSYGVNCSLICSGGCSDTCKRTDGRCDCKPGYEGDTCVERCPQGLGGVGCRLRCSEGCVSCSLTGTCEPPCRAEWEGNSCQTKIIYCAEDEYNTTIGVFNIEKTPVGVTFNTSELCHVDGRPMGEVKCTADGQGGGNWSSFTTNRACDYSDLDVSDISETLTKYLQGDKDIEEVIHTAVDISKNLTLNQLDVLIITNIMEKTTNLSEVSGQVATGVLRMYSTVIETPESTLVDAQERAAALNRILRSVDDVTGKIQPGPSGEERVSTETFVSQVWDLTNPNLTDENFPVGLLLQTSDDIETSAVNSVYNKSVDFSQIDAAIILRENI